MEIDRILLPNSVIGGCDFELFKVSFENDSNFIMVTVLYSTYIYK